MSEPKWYPINPSANFGPKYPVVMPRLIMVGRALVSLDMLSVMGYTTDRLKAEAELMRKSR